MSCVTFPTETQFQVVTATSNSLSTSFSVVETVLPPTLVTSTIGCSASASNSSCFATTVTITGAASTSTNTVPVTLTVPVTSTSSNPTRTLFSTSCSSSSTSTSSTSTSTHTFTSSSQSTSSTSPPSFTSVSTLPFSASSSPATATLSNGDAVTTEVIVATTSSPSSVLVTSSASPSLNQGGTEGGNLSSSKTGSIVGGAVGGIVAVLAIIGIIWYFRRRSKRWDDTFEKEDEKDAHRPRMSLGGEDVQPRPYHYGLVGHSSSPSPPGSPPLGAAHLGHSPSNSLSLLNSPQHHTHSSSGIALSSSASMSRSLADLASANPTPQSGPARPSLSNASSAAASIRPLLERPVNHTRVPGISTANILGVARSQQQAPSSPRPHSAGGSLQSASSPVPALPTAHVVRPHTSPVSEKRRLLASLPQGAATSTPPSNAIGNGSSTEQSPRTESRPPPIRQRNPNRPSSKKGSNVVTVHVDGGPAANPDREPPPEGNEPPAYSPS